MRIDINMEWMREAPSEEMLDWLNSKVPSADFELHEAEVIRRFFCCAIETARAVLVDQD